MKIQCDVCEAQQAIVFCAADEAALCHHCDRRVHHANKLAGKHQRFPLLLPSLKDSPLCDICQVRRAFLFCREDRAILCRECDAPIHHATEHTQSHSRFLLTGVKLAVSPAIYPNSSASSSDGCGYATLSPRNLNGDSNPTVGGLNSNDVLGRSRSPLSSSVTTSYHTTCCNNHYQMGSDQEGSISTSDYDIADYNRTSSDVMAVGPAGWPVVDPFDSSASDYFGCKTIDYTLPSGAQQEETKYGYQYF